MMRSLVSARRYEICATRSQKMCRCVRPGDRRLDHRAKMRDREWRVEFLFRRGNQASIHLLQLDHPKAVEDYRTPKRFANSATFWTAPVPGAFLQLDHPKAVEDYPTPKRFANPARFWTAPVPGAFLQLDHPKAVED